MMNFCMHHTTCAETAVQEQREWKGFSCTNMSKQLLTERIKLS